MKIPTYTTVRLREYLTRYSWLSLPAIFLIAAAWLAGDPRLALAAVCVCFALFLFVWTRVWVGLCSAPPSPLWQMTARWTPGATDDILLSGTFSAPDRPTRYLDLRRTDIIRVADHGSYLLLYLTSEPELLIVPCDDITPELRNKLLE